MPAEVLVKRMPAYDTARSSRKNSPADIGAHIFCRRGRNQCLFRLWHVLPDDLSGVPTGHRVTDREYFGGRFQFPDLRQPCFSSIRLAAAAFFHSLLYYKLFCERVFVGGIARVDTIALPGSASNPSAIGVFFIFFPSIFCLSVACVSHIVRISHAAPFWVLQLTLRAAANMVPRLGSP